MARKLGRAVSARRPRSYLVLFAILCLPLGACLRDAATGPEHGPARLSVSANVTGDAARAVTALGVQVEYMRGGGGPALLSEQEIPLGEVAPGGSVTRPLTLELGPCLADPDHLPGGGTCRVTVRVTLLAGVQPLDVVTIGPLDLRAGQTAEPQAVTLRAASTLSISPTAPAPLYPGDRLQLAATLTDASGQVVGGREVEWTSSAPAVATVDPDGRVTAVAPGGTVVSATAGGRTATTSVTVQARPSIKLSAASAAFSARSRAPIPAPLEIAIANGAGGALTGLALGPIVYEGGATGWLAASLAGGSAPTTLSLRPSTTSLQPGRYSASVPLVAPGASNSGTTVRVTFEVLPGAFITLGESNVEFQEDADVRRVEVTTSIPVSRLDAEIRYQGYGRDWLEVRVESGVLLLALGPGAGEMAPGRHSATVTVNAPEASAPATLNVSYEVSTAGWQLFLVPSDPYAECLDHYGSVMYLNLYRYEEPFHGRFAARVRVPDPGAYLLLNGRKEAVIDSIGHMFTVMKDTSYHTPSWIRVIASLEGAPAIADTLVLGVNQLSCGASPRRDRAGGDAVPREPAPRVRSREPAGRGLHAPAAITPPAPAPNTRTSARQAPGMPFILRKSGGDR